MSSNALTPDDALIDGAPSYGQVTSDIASPLEQKASRGWWYLITLTGTALLLGVALTAYTIATGIGIPRSTVAGWLKRAPQTITTAPGMDTSEV